jgi:hypothetical protein
VSDKFLEAFKNNLRAVVNGANTDIIGQMQMATVLLTADLRAEVLTEKADALESELIQSRKRLKELSRKLGG